MFVLKLSGIQTLFIINYIALHHFWIEQKGMTKNHDFGYS